MGAFAAVAARAHGLDWLERELLAPWRESDPPFVLSDACPGELLPAPASLPLVDWPEATRKRIKRTAWLTREQFAAPQRGEKPALPALSGPDAGFVSEADCLVPAVNMRNTLSRLTDTTGDAGSLYSLPVTRLAQPFAFLSLYARVAPGKEAVLLDLLHLLAESGFGADASAGFGHFTVAEKWDDESQLDQATHATGWISLSTFQPAPADSTEGYWKSFVKYGKLGPDFGVEDVFKRPQWMMRPGACFRSAEPARDWYGRLIPTEELLAPGTAAKLAARGIRPAHPAFALAVPMKWRTETEG